MKVEQFTLERMQSIYENQVDINLSESGVAPLKLSELVDDSLDRDALLAEALRYTQSNGTLPLRTAIAARQHGKPGAMAAGPDYAGANRLVAHETDRGVQSEQSDGSTIRSGRSGSNRGHRRPPWRLDPGRRDLPRRGT